VVRPEVLEIILINVPAIVAAVAAALVAWSTRRVGQQTQREVHEVKTIVENGTHEDVTPSHEGRP
jgi:hypothetical protein